MQKLVWINSKGTEINLTSGDYGITEWEGFSACDLEVQTQNVPFQDGSVFLDALLNNRELSVTLAINDGKDLEKRYRLRRELISALNPKLGEGYLIYTNDFISKRIKCLAQMPVFPTHNSDKAGTPKASLSWTACDPYWEDLEETSVVLKSFNPTIISNNGDVECNIVFKCSKKNTEDNTFTIKNDTLNQKITINGLSGNITVDTNNGKKNIQKNIFSCKAIDVLRGFLQIAYSDKIIIALNNYGFYKSIDNGESFSFFDVNTSDIEDKSLIYVSKTDLFYFLKYENSEINVYSLDKNMNIQFLSTIGETISSGNIYWTYIPEKEKFIASDYYNNFNLISADAVTWTSINLKSSTGDIKRIRYIEELNLCVAIYDNHVLTSEDLEIWADNSLSSTDLLDFDYDKISNCLRFLSLTQLITSEDAINYTITSHNLSLLPSLPCIVQFNNNYNYLEILVLAYDGKLYLYSYANNTSSRNVIQSGFNTTKAMYYKFTYYEPLKLFLMYGIISASAYQSCNDLYTILPYNNYEVKQSMSLQYDGSLNYFQPLSFYKGEGFYLIGANTLNSIYNSGILRSEDLKNWSVVLATDTITPPGEVKIKEITSNNQGLIIAHNTNYCYISVDKGYTWESITPLESGYQIEYILFKSDENIFIMVGKKDTGAGTSRSFYSSINGISWSLINTVQDENVFTDIQGFIYISEEHKYYIQKKETSGCSIYSSLDLISFSYETGLNYGLAGGTNSFYYSKDLKCLICILYIRETYLLVKDLKINTWKKVVLDLESFGISIKWNNVNGLFYISTYMGNTYLLNSSFLIMDNVDITTKCFADDNLLTSEGIYAVEKTLLNQINKISSDSDLKLQLGLGKNQIVLSSDKNSADGLLTYRQKYIGV